jgi:hypothetical protein
VSTAIEQGFDARKLSKASGVLGVKLDHALRGNRMTATAAHSDTAPIDLSSWRMAGAGGFRQAGDVIQSYGGPGILWYEPTTFRDFVLRIEWRVHALNDNSGVFIRIPPLGDSVQRAIDEGYEVQIDERGHDPESGRCGSALHATGAIYKLAPAKTLASRAIGEWNAFEITARGPAISVWLNGVAVSQLENGSRRHHGHIGLQAHHAGSTVEFRNLAIAPL